MDVSKRLILINHLIKRELFELSSLAHALFVLRYMCYYSHNYSIDFIYDVYPTSSDFIA